MQHEYLQDFSEFFPLEIGVIVHFCKPVSKRVPCMVQNQDDNEPRQAKTRKVSVPISSQMERSSDGICGRKFHAAVIFVGWKYVLMPNT